MACITHAAQIDLRLGDAPCQHSYLGVSIFSRDLACQCFNLFR